MSWPDQKETKLKDLKLKDAVLTFSAERKVHQITRITVEYKLTIHRRQAQRERRRKENGGQKREFDIEGSGEKAK